MIACGWCGVATMEAVCSACGRDPGLPWAQRGQLPPIADASDTARRRLAAAVAVLGRDATVEQVAEYLDVSPRTVRRWRELAAQRPSPVLPADPRM